MSKQNEVYFWGTHDLDTGFLSNWYSAQCRIGDTIFANSEQLFMAMKADTFDDEETFNKILLEPDPKAVKALGRTIKGFDEKKWEEKRVEIMYTVNFIKYTQNPKLLQKLFDTGEADLIEASPLDSVWGSGWNKETHLKNHDQKYPGLNLLGKILTALRDDLLYGNIEPTPIYGAAKDFRLS